VAISIVGTANRNENSADCFLFNPISIQPMMVLALLETPGTIAKD